MGLKAGANSLQYGVIRWYLPQGHVKVQLFSVLYLNSPSTSFKIDRKEYEYHRP
jgi:hypothetical protein